MVNATARDVFRDIIDLCWLNLLFAGVGLIPGYLGTILTVDTWGRKKIQLMGFAVLTGLFTIMGMSEPSIYVTETQLISL